MNAATAIVFAATLAVVHAAGADELHTFQRTQLSDQFWSEGANAADLNNDGVKDVISGPYWWEGPGFTKRHEYYPATTTFQLKVGPSTSVTVPGFEGTLGPENKYSDNFFVWPLDFNKDGWTDILVVGFPGTDSSWFENPKGKDGHWTRHKIFAQTDNESPAFADLTGDGKPELVCITRGRYGYAEPDWSDPSKPWTFHAISPDNKYGNFTHGMGIGDVNGDGRRDLLEKNGWWEQPASLAGDPVWTFHAQPFGAGGSQMYAYDVNGDGLADVITALEAHAFGLAWYEQVRNGGEIAFRQHVIMNRMPADNPYGVKFSEIHAIDLVDMDGDGLLDILTGKRFWSHGRMGDPDRNDAAVLYWFRLARGANGRVDFVPYLIDSESGVGTQVVATDLDGNGLPDIVVGNKRGTFVHLHQKRTVTRDEWEKAQPRRTSTDAAGAQDLLTLAAPGQTAYGELQVPAGSDAATTIQVAVIRGARPGRTVAFVAGSHGTEYASIVALTKLIERIDPKTLAGTAIVVPLLNVASFEQMTVHLNPVDRKGMNAGYPGAAGGTQTERALALVAERVVAPADVIVDLHGGDLDEDLRPYSYWTRTGNPAQDEAARTLVLAFGLDHVIVRDVDLSNPASTRSLGGYSLSQGKTMIVAEAGRAGLVLPADVDALVAGCLNVLGSLKMLARPAPPAAKPVFIGTGSRVAAEKPGMFYATAKRDAVVKAGDVLGYITDYVGRRTGEVTSPIDGLITFIRPVPSMWQGATLANVSPILASAPRYTKP